MYTLFGVYIISEEDIFTYLSCAHLLYQKCTLIDVLTHCGVYGGIPGVYSHFSHSTPSKTPSLAYACTLQSNVILYNIIIIHITACYKSHMLVYLFMKEVKEVLLPFFRRNSVKFEFLHICLQEFI